MNTTGGVSSAQFALQIAFLAIDLIETNTQTSSPSMSTHSSDWIIYFDVCHETENDRCHIQTIRNPIQQIPRIGLGITNRWMNGKQLMKGENLLTMY